MSNSNSSLSVNEDTVIMSALGVNLPLFGICCGIYVVLHTMFRLQFYQNPISRGKGPGAPTGIVDFVRLVWAMGDDEFEQHAGLDAWTLIEFIRVVLRVLSGFGAFGLTVLLLATLGSSMLAGDGYKLVVGESTLARISLANMRVFTEDEQTWDMWGTAVTSALGCWLLTYLTITRLKASWRKIISRRLRSLADARDPSSLVVLVRAGGLRGKKKTVEEVRALWEQLYPGQIWDIIMVRDTGKLPALLAKRKKLLANISKAEVALNKVLAKGVEPKQKLRMQLAKKQDELGVLIGALKDEYELRSSAENDTGSNYFVRFRQHRACNIAKQVVNTPSNEMRVIAAPLLEDVAWTSLRPAAEKVALPMRLASKAGYFALLVFYVVPIATVSGFLTLTKISSNFPFLVPVLEALGETGRSFLTAFLPTLAMLIFLAILPTICKIVASKQGYISIGHVQRDAFHRLFMFQFIWVFLGVTLGSSVFALAEKLQQIAESPMVLLITLGGQLADSATFFMVYLSLQSCFALPFKELTRAVPIGIFAAKQAAAQAADFAQKQALQAAKLAAEQANKAATHAKMAATHAVGKRTADETTDVEAAESQQLEQQAAQPDDSAPPSLPVTPEPFDYPVAWSKVMLATTLGMCYASVQPLSILFAFVYLLLSYFLYARGLLFSYTHASESRGAFWPAASARLMVILFVAQLMLTIVHYIKQNTATAVAVALSMPITYYNHRVFVSRFEPQLAVLPLINSTGADFEAAGELSTAHDGSETPPSGEMTAARLLELERARFTQLFGDTYYQPELLEAAEIIGTKFRAPSMVRNDNEVEAMLRVVHLQVQQASSSASGMRLGDDRISIAGARPGPASKGERTRSLMQRLSLAAGVGAVLPVERIETAGLIEAERSERVHAEASIVETSPKAEPEIAMSNVV